MTLIASGFNSYIWSNGVHAPMVTIKPKQSGLINVYAVAENSCNTAANIFYSVKPSPQVDLMPYPSVCKGNSIELTAYGSDSCVWSNGAIGKSVILTPLPGNVFGVAGINKNGCFDFKFFSIDVLDCGEKSTNEKAKIFPNPARESFFIELTEAANLKVFYPLGQVILQDHLKAGSQNINLEKYCSGLYVIVFYFEDGTSSTFKLIKI